MKNYLVTICIPSRYENKDILELCIKSIRKYTVVSYKILIGDAGIGPITKKWLEEQDDVDILICPDWKRPKVHLANNIKTPYFVILHDDVQILKEGWLKRRLDIMENDPKIGVLGVVLSRYLLKEINYLEKNIFLKPIAQFLKILRVIKPLHSRFFPLGLVVRKEVQDLVELYWGKAGGFDTGAFAYLQFRRQKRWKFKKYHYIPDIRHWGEMTWVQCKNVEEDEILKDKMYMDEKNKRRNKILNEIKEILVTNNY